MLYKKMNIQEIYESIGYSVRIPNELTFGSVHLSNNSLDLIREKAQATTGVVPNYIPNLEHVDGLDDTALCIGTVGGELLLTGKTKKIVSAQSCVKIFLYAYALHRGATADSIAGSEPVGMEFNQDPVIFGKTKTAAHPLNNAGGISAASEIDSWDDFLLFIRSLTGNDSIDILEHIYLSEKKYWQSNLRIAAALTASGRIPHAKMERSLDYYTMASSLGVSCEDMLNACLTLARGGIDHDGKRIIEHNHVVHILNAMNTFGLYTSTGKMTLLQAGTRPISSKSGVSGLVITINPHVGAYVSLGHHLDMYGNSVFGMQVATILNDMLSFPGAMRLDATGKQHHLDRYYQETVIFTKKECLARLKEGIFKKCSFKLSHDDFHAMIDQLSEEEILLKDSLLTCKDFRDCKRDLEKGV